MGITEIILIITSIRCFLSLILIYGIIARLNKKLKEKNELIYASDSFVEEELGSINSIVGKVKSGKSSFLSALSMSQSRVISRTLDNRLEQIKNDLYYLNFNEINRFLDNAYSYTIDTNLVGNELFKTIGIGKYIMHDFVNIKMSEDLVKKYAKYYYHLNIKDCYIFTMGISIYDRVNNSPSKIIPDEALRIKEVKDTKKFPFDECAFVLSEDEKSVKDGNTKSYSKAEKESGAKELKIFWGHTGEETTYWNTTKQIMVDEIVTTRRLSIACWETIRGKMKLYNFPFIQRMLDIYLRIHYWFFKLRFIFVIGKERKARKMDTRYNSPKCRFRKARAFVQKMKFWCDSQGLLVHEGNLYKYSVIDGGLKLEAENVKLAFPYRESRGTYNCYEFKCVGDKLREMSEIKSTDIPYSCRFGTKLDEEKTKFLFETSKDKEGQKETKIVDLNDEL